MTDEAEDGTFELGGWTIYPPGEEEPDDLHLDERMRENLRRSAYTAQGVLLLGLLLLFVVRLVRDRELDRGLLGLFLAGLGVDVGLQLYYQWKQQA